MSMVIWFKRQDDPTADDDDRLYLFREAEFLDALADSLGVRRISSFFDFTEINATFTEDESDDDGAEGNEAWHEPSELLTTLEALHARLTDGKDLPSDKEVIGEEMKDELQGCIIKARSAIEGNAKVHLCVVM